MSEKSDHTKVHIERAIDRAREGVGEHVDELDRHLREALDFGKRAGEHAPQLMMAGAAIGFLAGFGLPRKLMRGMQVAIPLLIVASVAKARFAGRGEVQDDDL